ncbi:MAG: Beta-galactosidase, partial [Verrucomicrobiota bacterium]
MKHCLSYFLFCLYFIGVASSAVTGATGPHAERLDTWRFIEGDPHGAHLVDFDDADWEDVHLPHDWSIGRVPQRDAPSSRGGGFFSTGVGWYRTGIEAPEAWREQQVELLFEGSYRATEVW